MPRAFMQVHITSAKGFVYVCRRRTIASLIFGENNSYFLFMYLFWKIYHTGPLYRFLSDKRTIFLKGDDGVSYDRRN